uniref:Putative ixodes 8-cys protein n=1 Tax=Ixodes ricinus TaxID=34613 RepID=A0A0K8RJS6_IXORI
MARLICIFLVILLAYQYVHAIDEKDLPPYVPNKHSFLQHLKELCYKSYGTRVVASANLPKCTITCARGAFNGLFGGSDTVTLRDNEPCDWTAQCIGNQGCVYIA